MDVIRQSAPTPSPIPGVTHATWAGRDEGLAHLSVWRQALAPGASTPCHRHDCDEIVLCVAGWGELQTEDRVQRFGPDCTVVLPRRRWHRLVSVGPMALELIAVFGATPVTTELPDGSPLAMPWRT